MWMHEFITACGNKFNEYIEDVRNILNGDDNSDESFNGAIARLNMARDEIKSLEKAIKELKQEEHDLTQDIYNKFKDKGYVSTIKF